MTKHDAFDLLVRTLEELVPTMEEMLKLVRNRAVHVRARQQLEQAHRTLNAVKEAT